MNKKELQNYFIKSVLDAVDEYNSSSGYAKDLILIGIITGLAKGYMEIKGD